MQYRSPIPILRYSNTDIKGLNASRLNKIQRELLVELDLMPDQVLEIDGQSFTKDDIIATIEQLKEPKVLQFHEWIYQSSALVNILQYQEFTDAQKSFDFTYQYHRDFKEFKNFLSPYLAQPLGKMLGQACLKSDFKKAQELLVFTRLISDNYFDEAFGKLRNILLGRAKEIKDMERNVGTFQARRLDFVNLDFINFLNALPDQLVALRESIVNHLINLSVALQHVDFEFCGRLYSVLRYVQSETDTKAIIDNNLKVFSKRVNKKEEKPQSSRAKNWAQYGVTFFVVITILRACINSYSPSRSTSHLSNSFVTTQAHLDMLFLRGKIKRLTGIQLDPKRLDSLMKHMAISPYYSPSNWPYPEVAADLKAYRPVTGQKVFFNNKSQYDAVIFLGNSTSIYSAFLPAGDTLQAEIVNKDVMSVYIGNDWNFHYWFRHQQNTTLSGLFEQVDSTSLLYINKTWEFDCNASACREVTVDFVSPVKDSFKAVASQRSFKNMEFKGQDAIKPDTLPVVVQSYY